MGGIDAELAFCPPVDAPVFSGVVPDEAGARTTRKEPSSPPENSRSPSSPRPGMLDAGAGRNSARGGASFDDADERCETISESSSATKVSWKSSK